MSVRQMTGISLFAALLAVSAQITIPTMLTVPFTLQTLMVLLTGLMLDRRSAFYSILLYMLLGIVGIPVFSGFKSGIGVVFGPTGGYLFGFCFGIFAMGLIKELNMAKRFTGQFAVCIMVVAITHIFGIAQYAFYTKNTISSSFIMLWAFIPVDAVKALIAVISFNIIKSRISNYIKY